MKEMGFISRRADPEVFDRVVQYFHDKMRGQMSVEGFSLKDLKFEPEKSLGSLLDLRDLNVSLADLRDAFHIPKEWILLERTLLLLLGVCTTLDPEMNPTDDHRAVPRAVLLGEKKQWSEIVRRGLARDGAGGAVAAGRAAAVHGPRAARRHRASACATSTTTRALLYYGGQQLLWGMLAVGRGRPGHGLDGAGSTRLALAGRSGRGSLRSCSCWPGSPADPAAPAPLATLTGRDSHGISNAGSAPPMRPILVNIPSKLLFASALSGGARALRRGSPPAAEGSRARP